MLYYVLKRKDEDVAILGMNEDGTIQRYRLINEDLAPLHDPKSNDWLKKWWSRRSVPIAQSHIKEMLIRKDLVGPEEYLMKNLGLSLTDYYWICPNNHTLCWKDVNLFENAFHEDITIGSEVPDTPDDIPHYTPNGSLQGTLEKCWTIRKGERGMIKGNRTASSEESINEAIASHLHELQGFPAYTPYELLEIHGREYSYGCYSRLFTSLQRELITAYDIENSMKKSQDINTYEHLIRVCEAHGLAEDVLRPFLEYQIMTDFIISGRDRHLANISILRDAESLQFVAPAPIYDSGKSMFVYDSVPGSDKGLLRIETESFASNELSLLGLVKDRSLVDVSKLPERSYIESMYRLDPHMEEKRIQEIGAAYEKKIDLFSRWQNGENLRKTVLGYGN